MLAVAGPLVGERAPPERHDALADILEHDGVAFVVELQIRLLAKPELLPRLGELAPDAAALQIDPFRRGAGDDVLTARGVQKAVFVHEAAVAARFAENLILERVHGELAAAARAEIEHVVQALRAAPVGKGDHGRFLPGVVVVLERLADAAVQLRVAQGAKLPGIRDPEGFRAHPAAPHDRPPLGPREIAAVGAHGEDRHVEHAAELDDAAVRLFAPARAVDLPFGIDQHARAVLDRSAYVADSRNIRAELRLHRRTLVFIGGKLVLLERHVARQHAALDDRHIGSLQVVAQAEPLPEEDLSLPVIEEVIEEAEIQEVEKKKDRPGLFAKFKQSLSKTRSNISDKITTLVKSNKKLDEDFWEELEEILIEADVGVNTSVELVSRVRESARKKKIGDSSEVMALIKQEVKYMLESHDSPLSINREGLTVILVVGVNGAGKTTSIAKMAYHFKNENNKVILAAADTFRAAAIDQLQIWADRVGVEIIKHREGSDPGAVVYDAMNAARARKADILIIDTAGRLHNKANLMKEIGKVRKIIERETPGAPHEVLLVLDATTGQNAISQARIFEEATGVSGIILTKLDGTAKGGIVLAIAQELKLPVKLVGLGESLQDLRDFSAEIFADALFEE